MIAFLGKLQSSSFTDAFACSCDDDIHDEKCKETKNELIANKDTYF